MVCNTCDMLISTHQGFNNFQQLINYVTSELSAVCSKSSVLPKESIQSKYSFCNSFVENVLFWERKEKKYYCATNNLTTEHYMFRKQAKWNTATDQVSKLGK